ncbi:MAG: PEPxxWA-CTERM sorting domain-containing protein [Proteobacteria bacterium]|nr:PEPxxWA-CTERM sorting domain-containing protein [Pseudomonadota bacterium]
MLRATKLAAAFSVGLIASTSAFAGAIIPLVHELKWEEGSDSFTFPIVDIGFGINFGGSQYSQAIVMDKGGITLWGNYNQQLYYETGDYIETAYIAPFHNTGMGMTHEPNYRGTVSYGNTLYDGHLAFAVNWSGMASYDDPSLSNSFQLMLVDRSDTGAGNFDFIFNYDAIEWLYANATPRTGVMGYSTSGQPGWDFSNAANAYGYWIDSSTVQPTIDGYQLPYMSWNSDVDGRWVFEVRNGIVTNPLPSMAVPEPETWAMLLAGLGLMAGVTRRRRANR